MIPRKRFDIGWIDLLRGMALCLWPQRRGTAQQRAEAIWGEEGKTLACLSVRSGFDALLGTLDFPAGSEIAMSAVTIGDMARIAEEHGLVPVPVDVDLQHLAVDPELLVHAITPKTRALVVAHLFGSRMEMEEILRVAGERGLLVIEDCAQGYVADGYAGNPRSDVSLFSFGPIKTATALGGGLMRFRDRSLRTRVAAHQEGWPVQSRDRFGRRLFKYSLLKLLSWRLFFSAFTSACRMVGQNHDGIISASARGLAGSGFFAKIRQRPSAPLLTLLTCRLRGYDARNIEKRASIARRVGNLLGETERPGKLARHHSHWIFPIMHPDPEGLMHHLWQSGFDATRGTSSLCAIAAPPDHSEKEISQAALLIQQILFLPVHTGLSHGDAKRLAQAIAEFNTMQSE
jgi:perosamine synthetase